MAKFQITQEITVSIQRIIMNAKKELVLISPYIKLSVSVKELLQEKLEEFEKVNRSDSSASRGIFGTIGGAIDKALAHSIDPNFEIRWICREVDLRQQERKWLAEHPAIKVGFRENLHAKCYLNEREALVTSMNLHEYSEQKNDEMGILVSASSEDDRKLYRAIRKQAERIWKLSDKCPIPPEDLVRPNPGRTKAPETAFCIRCGTDIRANPLKPYCRLCYKNWNGNKNNREKHCHTCGKEHEATMKKPVCLDCHRKYKNVLEFAAG